VKIPDKCLFVVKLSSHETDKTVSLLACLKEHDKYQYHPGVQWEMNK
jgi:hypothetical protein